MSTRIFKNILLVCAALSLFACSFLTGQIQPTPNTADIEKEEQAVYSFFMPESGTALILQETSIDMSEENPREVIDYIKSGLKNVSKDTLNSYLKRNEKPSQISPDMDLGVDYVLLSADELHDIASQSNWGEVLHEKYPDSNGYLIFSRVGFNNTLDQALIYVGNVRGPLMGAGDYYLMEKKDGQWILKEQISVWIS